MNKKNSRLEGMHTVASICIAVCKARIGCPDEREMISQLYFKMLHR